ncbi:MAG: hypothetical protein RL177_1200, partial [Bacteroidota bacterium]
TGTFEVLEKGEDLDVEMLKQGYAAVTPIHYDLTAHAALEHLRQFEL